MSTFQITFEEAKNIASQWGTPVYVYDEKLLSTQAATATSFPAPYGLTVRYAMKAAPNAKLLQLFNTQGLHFDASSGYEVRRLLKAGVSAEKISLSTQELPSDFAEFIELGVLLNACSLSQLEAFGKKFTGSSVGVRFNPGLGSGGTNRTNVGGIASSFGIWKDYLPEVLSIADKYELTIDRVHSHIGSGSDPEVWERAAGLTLSLVEAISTVTHMNLGGGFKVARIEGEISTDLTKIGAPVRKLLESFAERTGRKIHLELEPGTYLVGNAGAILSTVTDVVDTGAEGYQFIKLDTGMTDVLRPSMYGSQHPISILSDEQRTEKDLIVVGHCCESGDILTPMNADPEALGPRKMLLPEIGDLAVIGGSGAYCSGMSAKNYNSFPESPEVLRQSDGTPVLIRKKQSLEQILENEV